jgi:hypothetical protein
VSPRTAWWATLAVTVGLFGVGATLQTSPMSAARSDLRVTPRGDDRVKASSSSSVVADADPKLTEIQKLHLQNLLLARDLAQARLEALVKDLTIPGYDLMATGEYRKQIAPTP